MNTRSTHEAITPTCTFFYNQLVDLFSWMNFGVLLVFRQSRMVGIRANYEASFYVNNTSVFHVHLACKFALSHAIHNRVNLAIPVACTVNAGQSG